MIITLDIAIIMIVINIIIKVSAWGKVQATAGFHRANRTILGGFIDGITNPIEPALASNFILLFLFSLSLLFLPSLFLLSSSYPPSLLTLSSYLLHSSLVFFDNGKISFPMHLMTNVVDVSAFFKSSSTNTGTFKV